MQRKGEEVGANEQHVAPRRHHQQALVLGHAGNETGVKQGGGGGGWGVVGSVRACREQLENSK